MTVGPSLAQSMKVVGRLVNLSSGEARTRFAEARVARLATIAAEGTPRLVPITFACLTLHDLVASSAPGHRENHQITTLDDTGETGRADAAGGEAGEGLDVIVTAVDHKPKRTAKLRRLDDIARDGRVSLLADEYDDDWSRLWWARADGVARVVEPPDPTHLAAVRALAGRYHQYRDHRPAGPAIVVTVTRWTGWSYR